MAGSPLEALFPQLSDQLAAQIGLHFPAERFADLERAIRTAAPELGFRNADSCIQSLLSMRLTTQQIEILASHLTVGETYFFRDKVFFRLLREQILPRLIERRRAGERRLRIWSAGCCTGEEAYSIAILLRQLMPDLHDWQISILATDINPHFLQKAEGGVYSQWSFRDVPAGFAQKYFIRTGEGKMSLKPEIRRMVQFSYLNLAQHSYPSLLNHTNALDLIICRNVLMYFSSEQITKTIGRFFRSLVDDGWLAIGGADATPANWAGFSRPAFDAVGFLHKPSPADGPIERAGGESPRAESIAPYSAAPSERPSGTAPTHNNAAPATPRATGALVASVPAPLLLDEATDLFQRGAYSDAAKLLLSLIAGGKLDESVAKAAALLARVYANEGKLAEALTYCAQAIAADKLNAGSHYLHATILQERGGIVEAIASLQRALYLDPHFVLAHFAMGNLSRQQGDMTAARKHFANAARLLKEYRKDQTLPESEGITAGRLAEVIASMTDQGPQHD